MNLGGIFLVLFGLWIAIGLGYAESWSGVCCQWYPLTVAIGLVIAGVGGILLLPDMTGNPNNVNSYSHTPNQAMNTKPSEMKCLCNRCNKIWYLDANELEDLQSRFQAAQGYNKSGFNISMLTALFDPRLSAQMTTSSVVASGSLLSLKKEIEEKTKCPNCNSKDISRDVVEMEKQNEKTQISETKKTKVKTFKKTNKSEKNVSDSNNNLQKNKLQNLKDLKELYDEELIDIDEFKQMKKEILGK